MKRLSLFGSGKLNYGIANCLTLTALFSDLHYETPGGLTKDQYEDDPDKPDLRQQLHRARVHNKRVFITQHFLAD
jgi:outer membrane receptor for Fe3+-dicitrate